jgi:hypothetical protein
MLSGQNDLPFIDRAAPILAKYPNGAEACACVLANVNPTDGSNAQAAQAAITLLAPGKQP